ncbi:MAG: hypothetical protein K1W04_01290 [Oscillospiraceae bacterium]
MKKLSDAMLVLVILICLTSCSKKEKVQAHFEGGTFYCEGFMWKEEPAEYYVFDDNGFGRVVRGSYQYEFSWEISEGKIYTTAPVCSSSCLEYKDGYLINPMNIFEGDVPAGETFETTLKRIVNAEMTIQLEFKKDGTVEVFNSQADKKSVVPYERENNLITINGTQDYLVVDDMLYVNPLKPYIIEEENSPISQETENSVDRKNLSGADVNSQWNIYLTNSFENGDGDGLVVQQHISPYGTVVINTDALASITSKDGQDGMLSFYVGQDTQSRHFYMALELFGIAFPHDVTEVKLSGEDKEAVFSAAWINSNVSTYAPNGEKADMVELSLSEDNGKICLDKVRELKAATEGTSVLIEYEMSDGSRLQIELGEDMASALNALVRMGEELLTYYYD